MLMAQSKTMKDEVLLNQKAFLNLEQHLLIDMEVRLWLEILSRVCYFRVVSSDFLTMKCSICVGSE